MFTTPELCLSQFNVEPGMTVADLGCGMGAYTLGLAQRVTSCGKVIAIDVQKNIVDTLAKTCAERGYEHVTVLWDNLDDMDGIALNESAVDRIVISNLLFQLDDIQKFASEVKRIAKPNCQILVVDWKDSFRGLGPTSQQVVSPQRAQELFEKVGLHVHKTIKAGDYHYGFVLQSKQV